MTFNKKDLLDQLIAIVKEKLDYSTREALSLKEAATNEESKAENKYDTRGLEASYMAQAQALRVSELKKDFYELTKLKLPKSPKKVVLGSLIGLIDIESKNQAFYLLLNIGGYSLTAENQVKVKTVSVSSPLGAKLLGKETDDEFIFRKKVYEINNLS